MSATGSLWDFEGVTPDAGPVDKDASAAQAAANDASAAQAAANDASAAQAAANDTVPNRRSPNGASLNGAAPNSAESENSPQAVLSNGQIRDVFQNERGITVRIDRARDDLLTEFGKSTLSDRYLMNGESFQDLFARVAAHFADDTAHAQRLYDYISRLWFMPATPVLSNGGTTRGLPISCFLNEADDSLGGILGLWTENVWLAARGGGIGSYWGNLRSIGERVGHNGKTSGVIPFIRVMDSLTLAISQGSLRRGSAACYMPVSHPEIEEFIEIRRPTGGDPNRKALNLHHGVVVPDAFMRAVEADAEWPLTSPKDGAIIRKIKARELWIRILTARIETGEPYILFGDHVNRAIPEHHKLAGLNVKMSNLCSEITLPTGLDHHDVGAHRGVLPVVAQLGDLRGLARPPGLDRGRHALPRQRARRLHCARARFHVPRPLCRPARALRGPRRDGLPLVLATQSHSAGKRHGQGLEPGASSNKSAKAPMPPRGCWPKSVAPARTPRSSA